MKRISILIPLFAIAVMLCTLQLCNRPEHTVHDLKPEKYWREQNEKELLSIDQNYQRKLSTLESKNDSLIAELNISKQKLKAAKVKIRQSGFALLRRTEKDSSVSIAEKLSDCDSLKREVISYVHQVDSTHDVYDRTIVHLENSLSLKDSSLNICRTSYEDLKIITEDNLRREQRLTGQLEQAIKSQKRKKIENKFLAGGFLILSGIITSLLLKGK